MSTEKTLDSSTWSSTYVTQNGNITSSIPSCQLDNHIASLYTYHLKAVFGLCALVILCLAIVGNLVVLLTVCLTKRLRTVDSALLVSLAGTDIIIGGVLTPTAFYNLLTDNTHTNHVSIYNILDEYTFHVSYI